MLEAIGAEYRIWVALEKWERSDIYNYMRLLARLWNEIWANKAFKQKLARFVEGIKGKAWSSVREWTAKIVWWVLKNKSRDLTCLDKWKWGKSVRVVNTAK